MSGGRLPNRPSSCYSSTPVKTSQKQAFPTPQRLDSDVLSDDEERFSLLSPIYSGSSDSDEDLEPSDAHVSSPFRSNTSSVSPVRCCLCLLFSISQPRNSVRTDFIEHPVIFVADVSYRGDHMIKYVVEMTSLRVCPLSVRGSCGWSGKPKKTVWACKRRQRRQAIVDCSHRMPF